MENRIQYIFGIHPVLEAVRAGKEIDKIYFKKGLEGPGFRELLDEAHKKGIVSQFVPVEKLNKLAKGGSHQGVAACLATIEYSDLEESVNRACALGDSPVFVLLDGVSDVRNLGAIARSVECAGANGIIVPAKGGAAINAEAVKASAGALLRIDTCRVANLRLAIFYLQQNGFKIVAATEKSRTPIYDVDMTGPVAIIMGSEQKGVSPSVLGLADETACIPMAGEISSLNVSAAASVVLFEMVRQRYNNK